MSEDGSTQPMTGLSPEIAQKVLGADLRNIVKKAGAGGTLNTTERKLVSQYLAAQESSADAADLLRQRQNALLQKWAKGERLSDSEYSEIKDQLPGSAQDKPENEFGEIDPEPINPEEHRKTTDAYDRKIKEYAETYDVHDRTVKTWIGKGRKAKGGPDFPPLDQPELMPFWWPRHSKWRVPDIMLQLASSARKTAPDPKAKTNSAKPELLLPEGLGFAAEIKRVREAAQRAAAHLDAAEESQNSAEIDLATRRYERATKLLREYERDASKVLEAQGSLVSKEVLEPIIRQANTAACTRLRTLINRVDPLLQGETELNRRRKIWHDALDEIFNELERTNWTGQEEETEAA